MSGGPSTRATDRTPRPTTGTRGAGEQGSEVGAGRESSQVIFEFQRELSNGEWKALGLSRTGTELFDVDAAALALKATWDGPLPAGAYRVRSPEGDSRWRYARVGHDGEFVLVDE